MGAYQDIATAAQESVARQLGLNVTYCQMYLPSDTKTTAQWAEEGRLWNRLLDGAENGLFELLDMGVDIRALIAREAAMRAGEARLLAAIANLPDDGDFLGTVTLADAEARIAAFDADDPAAYARPVGAFELAVDAQLAADTDAQTTTAGGTS